MIPSWATKITFSEGSLNGVNSLVIDRFPKLKSLIFEDYAVLSIEYLEITAPLLEELVFGAGSGSGSGSTRRLADALGRLVLNCPNLKTFIVGEGCLESIEVIQIDAIGENVRFEVGPNGLKNVNKIECSSEVSEEVVTMMKATIENTEGHVGEVVIERIDLTTLPPTTEAPTTVTPTTEAPTIVTPTTEAPTTVIPTTEAPTTEAPTTEVPLPSCPEGLVAYRIVREYGANPSSSETLTFYYGTGSVEFLSMTFTGTATDILTDCMKPQLLIIELRGATGGWNDDSYFTIQSAFGVSEKVTLQESSSNSLYFHHFYGFISFTEVTSCEEFNALPDTVNMVHVMDNACNDPAIVEFSTSRFSDLIYLWIGDEDFMYVKTFKVQNNSLLQYLYIQMNSFTEAKYYFSNDTSKSFHVLNCERLESIQIGDCSFSDYSGQFELKNLPQLQSIEIGTMDMKNYNFYWSSFVVQGINMIFCKY